LKGSGIKSLADLKGKRIGMGSSGLSKIMLNVILQQNGLTEKDVQVINTDLNPTQALLSSKIDIAAGLMRNVDVPQLELNGHKIAAFFPEEHGVPNYSVLIFVVNKYNAKDSRFPRFLSALKKAVRYLDEHPRESWLQFAKQYPEANNEVNRGSWFATMPYFAENPASFDKEEWEQFAKFMQQNNMIKKVQPMSRYTITS
jgi:putative hydroxymethylpyrimidine transport system substrate-binding protein